MTKTAMLATLTLVACPAVAQTSADGLPLSEILARIEAEADFVSFESVEWEDDHWEVEYRRADDSEVEVDIGPVTGEPRSR